MEEIEKNIRRIASSKGINIESLAIKINFTSAGLYKQFRNKSYKIDTLIKIAEALNVNLNSLIYNEGSAFEVIEYYKDFSLKLVEPIKKNFISINLNKIIEHELLNNVILKYIGQKDLEPWDLNFFMAGIDNPPFYIDKKNIVIIPESDKFDFYNSTNVTYRIKYFTIYYLHFLNQRSEINNSQLELLEQSIESFIDKVLTSCNNNPLILSLINNNILTTQEVTQEAIKILELNLFNGKGYKYISIVLAKRENSKEK